MHTYIHLKWLLLSRSRSSIRSRVNLDRESTKNDITGLLSKVDNAIQTGFQVAQLKGQSVKGQGDIGSYDSLLYYLKVPLRHMTINEHANMGLTHVPLFN